MADEVKNRVSTQKSAGEPYYDDFNKPYLKSGSATETEDVFSKNYTRILFKPGASVQARELNQIQTILQSQIDKFGQHIFKNNSRVLGGEPSVDSRLEAIEIQGTSSYDTISELNNLIGKQITNGQASADRKVSAFVTGVVSLGSNNFRLLLRYAKADTSGSHNSKTGAGTTTKKRFSSDDILYTVPTTSLSDTADLLSSTNSGSRITKTGVALKPVVVGRYSVSEGVFFVNGTFVYTEPQEIFVIIPTGVDAFDAQAALLVTENVITSAADASIADNALGAPNENASGADRLQTALSLKLLTDNESILNETRNAGIVASLSDNAESVIVLSDIFNSTAGALFENYEYNKLAEYVESRSYEESGNYSINPFYVNVREHENDGTNGGMFFSKESAGGKQIAGLPPGEESKYAIQIQPNTAYVQGKRFRFDEEQVVEIDKARTQFPKLNTDYETVRFQARIGGFIEVDKITGTVPTSPAKVGLFLSKSDENDNNRFIGKSRYDSNTADSNRIGTCEVKAVEYTGTKYKIYIDSVVMETGFRLRDAKFIAESDDITTASNNFSAEAGIRSGGFVLSGAKNKARVFHLGKIGISDVKDIKYVQKATVGSINVSGATQFSFNATGSNIPFSDNPNDYIVINKQAAGGPVVLVSEVISVNPTAGGAVTLRIPNTTSNNLTVTFPEQVSAQPIGHVVADYTTTIGAASYNPNDVITIPGVKIFSIKHITIDGAFGDAGAKDVTDFFEVDPLEGNLKIGADTKLIYRGRESLSNKAITIEGQRITYGNGIGAVNSYNLGGGFGQKASGASGNPAYDDIHVFNNDFPLSDALDFRTISGAVLDPNSIVEAKIRYYLPRVDSLVLDAHGKLRTITGVPAEDPAEPKRPLDCLHIANIGLPPFGREIKDVDVELIHNRRYTMEDIGKIEKRVKNLEYISTLNTLEKQAESAQIYDNIGLRLKTGILTDSFTGHGVGNPFDSGYNIAIDPQNNQMRAPYDTYNSKLIPKTEAARIPNDDFRDGSKTHSETVSRLPAFSREPMIQITKASSSYNVNPFAISVYIGDIKLTPSSDEWKSIERLPENNINLDDNFDVIDAALDASGVTGMFWGDWEYYWTGTRKHNYKTQHKKKKWYGSTSH